MAYGDLCLRTPHMSEYRTSCAQGALRLDSSFRGGALLKAGLIPDLLHFTKPFYSHSA